MYCKICGETNIEKFYPTSIKRNEHLCKKCRNKRNYVYKEAYRKRNLQKWNAYQNQYLKDHPELNRRACKQWHQRHKDEHNKQRLIYAQANPQRHRAQCYAYFAFPEAQPCQVEGCPNLGERHHNDYNKPTEIQWLCRKHHRQLHALVKVC